MSEQFWLGPTYEFSSGPWSLTAGVPAEEGGRLEWLLRRTEDGKETLSHSFMLEPHATREDLEVALGDLPATAMLDLVDQAAAQVNPRLLSSSGEDFVDSLA